MRRAVEDGGASVLLGWLFVQKRLSQKVEADPSPGVTEPFKRMIIFEFILGGTEEEREFLSSI